jgi:chromosome segregation ATPase
MADKPKTYPQQVQELKQQLEDAITERNNALTQASFIPEMQQEISALNAQLAARADQDNSTRINTKAQNTDLLQRAESAEQSNRNLQRQIRSLDSELSALKEALDIAGKERDKSLGKEEKIQLLVEELKNSNLRVSAMHQQLRDQQVATNEAIAQQEKEVLYLRQLTRAQKDHIASLTAQIEALPHNALAELRKLANGR